MAGLQSSKRKLACLTLVNEYYTFKIIDVGQSSIGVAKKYGVARMNILHWLNIFVKVEGKLPPKRGM